MRGDNGAAVWWLAPHRPAGPRGEGERWRGVGEVGGGRGETTQTRRGIRAEVRKMGIG